MKNCLVFHLEQKQTFSEFVVSKTFEILNLDEATICGSNLRTIIFAKILRDRSKILQLKTSYICLTSVTVKCRFVGEK